MTHFSDDGRYFWDGSQWALDTRATPEQPKAERWNAAPGLFAVGVILAVVIGYVLWHHYVYRNCIFAPTLFDWPSACL